MKNREDFFKDIELTIDVDLDKNNYFEFNIFSTDEQNIDEIRKSFVDKFSLRFLDGEKFNHTDFIKIKENWDYMEDEEDEEWVYNVFINPYLLYDRVAEIKNENEKTIVYRMANNEGKGVYAITGGNGLTNKDYLVPEDDFVLNKLFNGICPVNSKLVEYRNEWIFCCKSKEELLEWVDVGRIDFLKKMHIEIQEIEVNNNFLIEGKYQNIMKKGHFNIVNTYDADIFFAPSRRLKPFK